MGIFYSAESVIVDPRREPLKQAGVLVEEGVVQWVGSVEEFEDHPSAISAERKDYGESATILPGLIDTHVHLAFDGGPDPVGSIQGAGAGLITVIMLRSARQLLSVGVTTARDLGSPDRLDVTVREALRTGLARGPRLLTVNAPLTVTGGHCWFFGAEADGVEEVRKRVREARKAGADGIKVMSTGGNLTPGTLPSEPQYSLAELVAIVEEAHKYKMKVASHAHGREGIRRSIEAGVDSLEHFTFQDEAGDMHEDRELSVAAAARGIYVCKTFGLGWVPYVTSGRPLSSTMLRDLADAGVSIVAGTDSGIAGTPHFEYVAGLEAMASFGMTNSEVLSAATVVAAESLGLHNLTGDLSVGKSADMLVVDGDPLSDIGALRNILMVLANGVPYRPEFVSETTWEKSITAKSMPVSSS